MSKCQKWPLEAAIFDTLTFLTFFNEPGWLARHGDFGPRPRSRPARPARPARLARPGRPGGRPGRPGWSSRAGPARPAQPGQPGRPGQPSPAGLDTRSIFQYPRLQKPPKSMEKQENTFLSSHLDFTIFPRIPIQTAGPHISVVASKRSSGGFLEPESKHQISNTVFAPSRHGLGFRSSR